MNDDAIGLIRHEDMIQPFMLHNSTMRGRMVRLDHSLNAILSRHAYHDVISKQLGELMVIGSMLSSNLPPDGILTLQAKGDGIVSFMVADIQQDGSIRAYANINEAVEDTLDSLASSNGHGLADIFGQGYLAMTLDTPQGEPYQGIVPLEGTSFVEAVEHFFSQSQQLDVMFNIHVSRRIREDDSARWVAAGIMLERMPELSVREREDSHSDTEITQDWDYQTLLVNTATEEELSDPHLAPSALLYRLFNEGGVWVYDTQPLRDACRCSREKVQAMLISMSEEERKSIAVDDTIAVTCQFCSREERFELEELKN